MKRTAQRFRAEPNRETRGFTLIELLVVIAIIAILAAVVLIVINPAELIKRGHDSTRLSDLTNLVNTINVALQEQASSASDVLCNGTQPIGTPCDGVSYPLGPNTRSSNGSGWVAVDLKDQTTVSVPALPVDPVNSATYHYEYKTNAQHTTYEIDAVLESDKYVNQQKLMQNDGGNDNNKYEVGTDLTDI